MCITAIQMRGVSRHFFFDMSTRPLVSVVVVKILILSSFLVPDQMKSISCMEEKSRDRIQFICSTGKGAKNGKVEDDNDYQDGDDVYSSSPPLVISVQCDTSSSSFNF